LNYYTERPVGTSILRPLTLIHVILQQVSLCFSRIKHTSRCSFPAYQSTVIIKFAGAVDADAIIRCRQDIKVYATCAADARHQRFMAS